MLLGFLRRAAIGASLGAMLLAGGCSSVQPTTPQETGGSPFPWLKTYPATYGYFYATSQSSGTGPSGYQSGGTIFSSPAHSTAVDGGTMTAGNLPLSYRADGTYYSIGAPTFGAVSTWGLAGNPGLGIPAFTDAMYLPAEVKMSSPLPAAIISKSSPIPVSWNPDPNNDTVAVYFEYDISISRFANPSNPSTQYGRFYIVPDNGSFTIPAADLSGLPSNCYIGVYVARGAGKLTGTPTKRFYIYGATTSSGIFEVVP